jgi:hypothetical protein
MTDLIRFDDWIIDRNDIAFVQIIKKQDIDGMGKDKIETKFDLKLTRKNNTTLTLNCNDYNNAKKYLNYLTADANVNSVDYRYDHYIIREISYLSNNIMDLETHVKKLIKKIEKVKDKKG